MHGRDGVWHSPRPFPALGDGTSLRLATRWAGIPGMLSRTVSTASVLWRGLSCEAVTHSMHERRHAAAAHANARRTSLRMSDVHAAAAHEDAWCTSLCA
eukprot:354411-Chlamydomonas_euryale.AAC.7